MLRACLFLLVFLFSCTAPAIVPAPHGNSVFDPHTQLLSEQHDHLRFSAKLQDVSIRPGFVDDNVCSFWVEIQNDSEQSLAVSLKDLHLISSGGDQFAAQDPAQIAALLSDQDSYLMPYPFVGYYYLSSAAAARFEDQYHRGPLEFASRRSDTLLLNALPQGPISPGAKVSGLVYFAAELRNFHAFELRYHPHTDSGEESFSFSLPFSVEPN